MNLDATDLASGILDTPVGWVDQLQYSLSGAQTGDQQVVPGHSASVGISSSGTTTVRYFATDAAGNDEVPNALAVRVDTVAPSITGVPASDCTVWPINQQLREVAVVRAEDLVSGVASLQVTATSSEPSDSNEPDVVVTSDGAGGFVVSLRAERLSKGQGRVYTVTATATDLADNVRTMTTQCVVPHDRGK